MLTIPYLNYTAPTKVNHIYYILGYKFKFIPYIIAHDIANVISNWKVQGNPGGFIGGNIGFNSKYKEFLYSIPFNLYKETTPYYMAVEILKDLSSKYNFRNIEKAIEKQDDSFIFKESFNAINSLVDVDILTEDVKELLNIDVNKYIPLEVIKLLKETEDFTKLFSNNSNKEISKMRSYTQFKDIAKYKIILPTFKYNFTLKNYNLKIKSPNEIVLFRDVSRSAEKFQSTFKALLIYFINTYIGKNITVHEFTNKIIKTHKLTSIQEIKDYYNSTIKYYYSYLKFLPNYINNYSECFIVTSGKTDYYPKMLNCTVNAISKGGNKYLELLCKNTNGKYIQL